MLIRLFKKSENATNAYLQFRQKTIEAKRTDCIKSDLLKSDMIKSDLVKPSGEEHLCAVFAMLCDFNLSSVREGEKYASLACFADGKAEIYNSKGGIILTAEQQFEQIKKTCISLLYNTEKILELFKKTEDFFLPDKENARIYAVTDNGIYMIEYNMDFTWAHDDKLSKIRKLSDELIHMLRESARKK